jgi:hypothetical protein
MTIVKLDMLLENIDYSQMFEEAEKKAQFLNCTF